MNTPSVQVPDPKLERWVAKIVYTHRDVVGTISHIIQVGTREQCDEAARKHNTRYQTDDCIVEPWDPNKFHWPTPTIPEG